MVPGGRALISLAAGGSAMHPLPFLLYTGVGTAIWCGALAWGGMALGAQYERLSRLVRQAGTTVVVLLLLAAAAWILKRLWKRRRGA
jgi:membrane protein DedA with SNARE-associated domain